MAGHRLGDAAHVHGSAGHGHRFGGPCPTLRVRFRPRTPRPPGLLTSYLVANAVILPPPTGSHARFWPQALSAYLHHDLHGRLVLLRSGALAGRASAGPDHARSGRWRTATAIAIDSAGKLSRQQAIHGYGRLRLGIVWLRCWGPRWAAGLPTLLVGATPSTSISRSAFWR